MSVFPPPDSHGAGPLNGELEGSEILGIIGFYFMTSSSVGRFGT